MKLVIASTLWMRMTGLMVKSRCCNGEVLMLTPCKSIHTFGMQDALDVLFLDKEARVVLSERAVPASQMRSHAKAVAVLERRSDHSTYWPREGEKIALSVAG